MATSRNARARTVSSIVSIGSILALAVALVLVLGGCSDEPPRDYDSAGYHFHYSGHGHYSSGHRWEHTSHHYGAFGHGAFEHGRGSHGYPINPAPGVEGPGDGLKVYDINESRHLINRTPSGTTGPRSSE